MKIELPEEVRATALIVGVQDVGRWISAMLIEGSRARLKEWLDKPVAEEPVVVPPVVASVVMEPRGNGRLITPADAARMAGVGRKVISKRMADGRLDTVHTIGRTHPRTTAESVQRLFPKGHGFTSKRSKKSWTCPLCRRAMAPTGRAPHLMKCSQEKGWAREEKVALFVEQCGWSEERAERYVRFA